MLILPNLRLGFQEVPKVGSTAILKWLGGRQSRLARRPPSTEADTQNPGTRRLVRDEASGNLTVPNTAEAVAAYPDTFRFAVTRDPVRRFVSMYRNRVVHFRELSDTCAAAAALKRRDLPYDPQINDLVERWEDYAECGRSVAHHAQGQLNFLGPDLGVYHCLSDLSAMPDVVLRIRAHWEDQGMYSLASRKSGPEVTQAGGPAMGIDALSPASFEKLLHLYREDYDAIPTLNRDAIARAYAAARAQRDPALDAIPIEFLPPPATGPQGPANAVNVRVAESAESLTELVRMKLVDAPAPAPAGFHCVQGVVLLKADMDPALCRLFVRAGEMERPCAWPRKSEYVVREMPAHPHAAKSRFMSRPLGLAAGTAVDLMLTDPQGQTHCLATLQAP